MGKIFVPGRIAGDSEPSWLRRLGGWFRGGESPAMILIGLATVILIVWLTRQANHILERQNELIFASMQPVVSAALLPDGDDLVLIVNNAGPRATFQPPEPLTFLRFTYRRDDGSTADHLISLTDVFGGLPPLLQQGSDALGRVTSIPGARSTINGLCEAVLRADSRVESCRFDVVLVVRYQTSSEEEFTNHYLFRENLSVQVTSAAVERYRQEWSRRDDDDGAFSVQSSKPEDVAQYVTAYIGLNAPEFSAPCLFPEDVLFGCY